MSGGSSAATPIDPPPGHTMYVRPATSVATAAQTKSSADALVQAGGAGPLRPAKISSPASASQSKPPKRLVKTSAQASPHSASPLAWPGSVHGGVATRAAIKGEEAPPPEQQKKPDRRRL